MMRKSMVASGFVAAAVALLLGATPSTAEATHCGRRCGYSSCGSSCNSCYSRCSTCYAPSSCGTCYTSCAPTCAPACTTTCSTTCAPACNTCYVPTSCCGNTYYYSYRAMPAPAYVTYGAQPRYYTASPAPVAQRQNVIVTPVRYEARRTSLFGW